MLLTTRDFTVGRADAVEDVRGTLWRAHAPELTRYAGVLVGPDDACDVVSSVFVRLTPQRAVQLQNARAYLYRATTRVALNLRRTRKRRATRDVHGATPDVAGEPTRHDDVRHALASLSVQQRAVVYLTYWEDLPEDRVATLLGISSGSVRRHLSRGRARLREVLK